MRFILRERSYPCHQIVFNQNSYLRQAMHENNQLNLQ
jgi:hypothetical protein